MAMSTMSCKILDKCHVGPPPSKQQESANFPLSFFDIEWLKQFPMEIVLFYQFPCSMTDFLESIVPNLKKSLSETLQHYLPLAGNLIFPPNLGMPEIQFQPGDSVEVTIAEYSSSDSVAMMSYLTGNQPREVDKFYPLVPALPGFVVGSTKVGTLALQFTIFPDAGISIGLSFYHAAADASSIVGFLKVWSLIARMCGEGCLVEAYNMPLPLLDRCSIKDPITSLEPGYSLKDHYWNQIKNTFKSGFSPMPTPRGNSEYYRATFVLSGKQIQDLKNLIRSLKPTLIHVSSFVVSCAYVLTCMSILSEEELQEMLTFPMDARPRMDPPIPATYFGNCLAPGKAMFKLSNQYSDHDRLALCAAFIAEFLETITEKGPEIFRDADHWLDERWATPTTKTRWLAVVASPKFNFYDVDFGWGMLTKTEILCTDARGIMSLGRSRGSDGGLEIGLSSTKAELDAFALFFYNGLEGNGLAQAMVPLSS